tara:strand:+ start:599 stop:985 length:387 start_codon:yes stop_codon:yes gene_type:complete
LAAHKSECFFCNLPEERIISEGEQCIVIRDGYPVTELHTLIITRRHVANYFDLTDAERLEVYQHLEQQKMRIEKEDKTVSGFNIGMNCGKDAGQTVMHFHLHLIPRRMGDMDDPRGGVRGVIPEKQKY